MYSFVLRDIFQPLCGTVFYIYETIRNLIYLEIVLSSIVSRRDFVYSDHTSFVHRMMMMMHGKPHEFYELISPHAGTHHVRLLVHNGPPFEFMRMNPPPFSIRYQGCFSSYHRDHWLKRWIVFQTGD